MNHLSPVCNLGMVKKPGRRIANGRWVSGRDDWMMRVVLWTLARCHIFGRGEEQQQKRQTREYPGEVEECGCREDSGSPGRIVNLSCVNKQRRTKKRAKLGGLWRSRGLVCLAASH